MQSLKLLFKCCILCLLAFNTVFGYNSNATSIMCPYRLKRRLCDICISAANNSSQTESEPSLLLDSYLNYKQILIQGENDEFRIYYNKKTVWEYRHITITFYAWDKSISKIGRPLRGCCRQPLVAPSCIPEKPVSGDIYYSLTLFRASVLRYYKTFEPPLHQSSDDNTEYSKESGHLNGRNFWFDGQQRPFPPHQLQDPAITQPPRPPPPSTWLNYTRYTVAEMYSYVCVFSLDKEIVLDHKIVSGQANVESYLFMREVYNLPGYFYEDNIIYSDITHEEVECTSKTFKGTSIYNLSANDMNNDTFTCLILWFSLDDMDKFDVKCMPHNATYTQPTTISPNKTATYVAVTYQPPVAPTKQEDFLVVIAGSAAGFLVIISIVTCFMCKRKAVKKFIKSTKEVPEILNVVMNQNPNTTFDYNENKQQEKVTSFDEVERLRVVAKLQDDNPYKEIIFQNHSVSRMKQLSSEQLFTLEKTVNGTKGTSEDSGISSGISSGDFPLSEDDSDFIDRDIYNQVFEDDHSVSNGGDDSGLSSSIIEDNTEKNTSECESLSGIKVIENQTRPTYEIKDIVIQNKLSNGENEISGDNLQKREHESLQETVKLDENKKTPTSISSKFQHKDLKLLQTKTLRAGVYSSALEFYNPNNGDNSPQHVVQCQQHDPTNSLPPVSCIVQEFSCTVHFNGDNVKFLNEKNRQLDCNVNSLQSSCLSATDGYSSKEAFMLPLENVC